MSADTSVNINGYFNGSSVVSLSTDPIDLGRLFPIYAAAVHNLINYDVFSKLNNTYITLDVTN